MTNKTLSMTNNDRDTLRLVGALISQAKKEFDTLPVAVRDAITEFHTQETSLTHCLRWGEKNCEEVLGAAQFEPRNKSGLKR